MDAILKNGVLHVSKDSYLQEIAFHNTYTTVLSVMKYVFFAMCSLMLVQFYFLFTAESVMAVSEFLIVAGIEFAVLLFAFFVIFQLYNKLDKSKKISNACNGIYADDDASIKEVYGLVKGITNKPCIVIDGVKYFEAMFVSERSRVRSKVYINNRLYHHVNGLYYTFKMNEEKVVLSAH